MLPSNEVLMQIGSVLWSILVAIELVVRYFMIGIVPGNRRPTTAMAWLLGIFFLPVVGLLAYWLFANPRLSRSRLSGGVPTSKSLTPPSTWSCLKNFTPKKSGLNLRSA